MTLLYETERGRDIVKRVWEEDRGTAKDNIEILLRSTDFPIRVHNIIVLYVQVQFTIIVLL